ncbi:MAG: class I SAM-dependent DNA methyltransferase [Selenomonadaceae bacterium]|nr:class I SAM-dependent DNA methyltransferase [Selenomonadaceae bacterium]
MNAEAAKNFSFYWNGHGAEKQDCQDFWRDLLHDVFGVERTTGFIKFNQKIEDTLLEIDAIIERTGVLIEHKSFGVDLDRRIRQSDGEYLTPFEQAKRYAEAMPYSSRPRWIVTCDFAEFRIYDLAEVNSLEYLIAPKSYKPKIIKLSDLRFDYPKLKFLIDPNAKLKPEVKISADAAKIIQNICRAIDKNYDERDAKYIGTLCNFCARLIFCFYADDSQIFQQVKFEDWFGKIPTQNLREELQKLFKVLDTPESERKNFDDDLKKFPRVNGGLFDETEFELPTLNEMFELAVRRAHMIDGYRLNAAGNFIRFSWRNLSPTIFGALVESIFNIETDAKAKAKAQRAGGMYYTSEENIHKVIDPLFLDDLSEELANIKRMHKPNRAAALKKFQDKISSLNFLDPACGSGNFLTETYLSLRALENDVLAELRKLSVEIPDNPIKVTPRQFYGIEINDFAVAIARLALWISEIQMRRKTSWVIGRELPDLPLSKYISIQKANALRVDWKTVAPNVDYIIGNPPFVGFTYQTDEQKDDLQNIFPKVKNLDYVCCWFKKAADFIRGTEIRCAFVSTNSICQGETAPRMWKNLFEDGIHIDFAYRTFKWLSDSENMAHVHCVIVGFSKAPNPKLKKIFDGEKILKPTNINAYLFDAPNIFVDSRNKPLCSVPKMIYGNKPADGGNLIIEADDLDNFLRDEPAAEKFIHPLLGAVEFINGQKRYVLWLVDMTLDEIKKFPLVAERVEAVKNFRLSSIAAGIRKFAKTPSIFAQVTQPEGVDFILVPRVSSERRRYIPIGFIKKKKSKLPTPYRLFPTRRFIISEF